jgi:hypothetical protein
MKRRRCSSFVGVVGLTLTLAAAAVAQSAGGQACPEPPPCGSKCSNLPYVETNCWTTEYGPAKSDIVVVFGKGTPTDSTNMLECPSGPYALCFASGPRVKTGSNPNNKALPCVVDPSGKTASCSCIYFTSGTSYVDINGILNLNAWYETVAACGKLGERCRNIKNSKSCAGSTTGDCKTAPVCQYVRGQNPADPATSLVPGAAAISAFSLALAADYDMNSVTSCPSGRYAGCMTAACTFPDGKTPPSGAVVQCSCPIAEGPFQVGEVQPDGSPYPCSLEPGLVWSGSNTVNLEKPPGP